MYRSKKDQMLGGICAGMAREFGINVTILRIIWGFVALMYGIGFILYFILWALLPEK
jgi:phage shock protein C